MNLSLNFMARCPHKKNVLLINAASAVDGPHVRQMWALVMQKMEPITTMGNRMAQVEASIEANAQNQERTFRLLEQSVES